MRPKMSEVYIDAPHAVTRVCTISGTHTSMCVYISIVCDGAVIGCSGFCREESVQRSLRVLRTCMNEHMLTHVISGLSGISAA